MWRIYYGDGSVVSSEDEGPIPARDVQVIAQEDPVAGWAMQSSKDYYVRKGERWQGVDIFGLFDYLMDSGLVLFGRTVRTEEYQAIADRARAEMPIVKQAWGARERQG